FECENLIVVKSRREHGGEIGHWGSFTRRNAVVVNFRSHCLFSETYVRPPLILTYSRKIQNPALGALDQRAGGVFPERQGVADLVRVDALVVNAGNAAPVPALMVENLFDDVRLRPDVVHAGRDRSADVVQGPVVDVRALVEGDLGFIPTGETVGAHPE